MVVSDYIIASSISNPLDLFAATDAHLRTLFPLHADGGTTCTHVTFHPETRAMTVANLGDSAVRYWDAPGEGMSASADHGPCNRDEFIRVTAAGGLCLFSSDGVPGRVKSPTFLPQADGSLRYNADGVVTMKNVHAEAAAYLEGRHTPVRLAVTRAFGDYALLPYGMIANPSITTVPPPAASTTRAVVIASDGLWDVMAYDAIGALVRNPTYMDSKDATAAAAALMAVAIPTGRALFGPCQDNTSIVVVYL
jgi:serine/threonine protein phosphatase PrpC